MKTKNKLKTYYIIAWNSNCWDSFIQHQIDIWECYKFQGHYIKIIDFECSDPYYRVTPRKDFCFDWDNKKDIFTDIEKAKEYAIKKIDEMYLSRCKHLIEERDEAIKKINEDENEE